MLNKHFIKAAALFCVFMAVKPVTGQQLLVESLTGPVTKNEIIAFKTFIKGTPPPQTGDRNIWVYGWGGKNMEACGLMYEATRDTAILNQMIIYGDALLSSRNDLAAVSRGGQRRVWTGKIEPVWPPSGPEVLPAGGGVEQGQVISHLIYCARLVLETPAIWNLPVNTADPYAYGRTYKERALKYIKESDYVIDSWILPHFVRSSEKNHFYFPGPPNTYKPGLPAPWNQLFMLTNGMIRLVQCHLLLGDDAARVAKYDAVIQPNIDWFRESLRPVTSAAGTACYTWDYSLNGRMEDTNHAAYDSEGMWIAYNSGRYKVSFADMVPFANTYCDVVMARVTNGKFAGIIDGNTGNGSGHSGGDNYVRDEYLYLADFRPEKFAEMGRAEIESGNAAVSAPITARLLWQKHRRYTQVAAPAH